MAGRAIVQAFINQSSFFVRTEAPLKEHLHLSSHHLIISFNLTLFRVPSLNKSKHGGSGMTRRPVKFSGITPVTLPQARLEARQVAESVSVSRMPLDRPFEGVTQLVTTRPLHAAREACDCF